MNESKESTLFDMGETGTEGQSENGPENIKSEWTEEEMNRPIFEGGPLRKEVEEWKSIYPSVYFTPFEDEVYVWRTLGRAEYRSMIERKELSTLDREEVMAAACILWPKGTTVESLQKGKAGAPSLVSEMIMQKSAFVALSAPIKL